MRSRCFVGHLREPSTCDRCAGFLQKELKGRDWDELRIPHRNAVWLVSKRCCCQYRYEGNRIQPKLSVSLMGELLAEVLPLCGVDGPSQFPDMFNVRAEVARGRRVVQWEVSRHLHHRTFSVAGNSFKPSWCRACHSVAL
jgi:hypothetical protein